MKSLIVPESVRMGGSERVEDIARDIVFAARDSQDRPEEGTRAVVCVYFKSAAQACRVIDCLNDRYQSVYAHKIEIKLYN